MHLLLVQWQLVLFLVHIQLKYFVGAIQSIDKGQFEAAKVLGISKFAQVL